MVNSGKEIVEIYKTRNKITREEYSTKKQCEKCNASGDAFTNCSLQAVVLAETSPMRARARAVPQVWITGAVVAACRFGVAHRVAHALAGPQQSGVGDTVRHTAVALLCTCRAPV